MEIVESFWTGVVETPVLEWFAVATGILYVVFAAKRHIICWLFALFSSLSFVYLCFTYQLYIETSLQLFFVVMAVVGWLSWRPGKNKNQSEEAVELKTWSVSIHLLNIVSSGVVAFLIGFAFDRWTDQANPYTDAFTTVFSLVATFMVTRKVLENWIYWVVIDFVSIFLYFSRGLYLSSLLYIVFTVLAVFGFFAWYNQYKTQTET